MVANWVWANQEQNGCLPFSQSRAKWLSAI